jgi:hypothetical protein
MKKAIAIVLSVMFVFALSTATFAAEKKETAKKEMTAEKKAEKKKVAHRQITGEVTAVDAKANTITVKSKKTEATVTVGEKTKFMPKGKTIADVTVGERVHVKYTEAEGNSTAKLVKIEAKKAEKKMKMKMKKTAEKKMEEKKVADPAPKEEKAPEKKPAAAGY